VICVIGVAGGLSPLLEPGSLVAGREVGDQGGMWAIPDSPWQRAVLAAPGVTVGSIVSTPRILSRAVEKADCWRQLGLPPGAVVDLESAAAAEWARQKEVPIVLLRGISDGAEEDLPFDFNRMVGADGQIRRRKVLLAALVRPGALSRLWMLRGRVRLCAEKLSDVSYEVVLRK
jgi:nucleoside phosphorylase